MTQIEFQEKEFQFIENLKNSSLYQRMTALNKEINEDEELKRLAGERDSFLIQAEKETDAEKKHALLVSFNQKDNELKANEKMKEYLSFYQSLHQILSLLSDGMTGVIEK